MRTDIVRQEYDVSCFFGEVANILEIYPNISKGWVKTLVEILSKEKCSPEDLHSAVMEVFKFNENAYPPAPEIIKRAMQCRDRRWAHEDYYTEEPFTITVDE